MRLAPLGLRLRDIVNEKLLEKTTKSVKSVLLLIYDWVVGETKLNVKNWEFTLKEAVNVISCDLNIRVG